MRWTEVDNITRATPDKLDVEESPADIVRLTSAKMTGLRRDIRSIRQKFLFRSVAQDSPRGRLGR
jgi:hypothetical protein